MAYDNLQSENSTFGISVKMMDTTVEFVLKTLF